MARKNVLSGGGSLDELSLAGLVQELRESKQEALNLRFRNATGQLDNTAEIKRVRRQIARLNTLIRQREIAEADSLNSGAAR